MIAAVSSTPPGRVLRRLRPSTGGLPHAGLGRAGHGHRDRGRRLIDRWEMWQPSIEAIGGTATYPMFDRLVAKMRAAEL
jgi:hypothetical protein